MLKCTVGFLQFYTMVSDSLLTFACMAEQNIIVPDLAATEGLLLGQLLEFVNIAPLVRVCSQITPDNRI
jgi:hypothetical protein